MRSGLLKLGGLSVSHLKKLFAAMFAASFAFAAPAAAEWPEKPVKIIVPFGAGGTADTIPRTFEKAISEQGLLDQPMTILNVGGHFSVGSKRVMEADPDGYEFLLIQIALMGAEAMGAIDFGWRNFEPVALTGRFCNMISVSAESKYQTLEDLMEDARDGGDPVLAGVNIGGQNHITMILLESSDPKAKFRHVQTGGGTKVFPALVGGHIDVGTQTTLEIVNNSVGPDGKLAPDAPLRPIAYTGTERDPQLPMIPTATEQGYEVNFCPDFWWLAPKGTPQEAIDGLADALEAAADSQGVKDLYASKGFLPTFLRGEEFNEYLVGMWANLEGPLSSIELNK